MYTVISSNTPYNSFNTSLTPLVISSPLLDCKIANLPTKHLWWSTGLEICCQWTYLILRIILTKIINTFQYEEANTIDKGGYNVIYNPPSGSPEMKSISTWVSRTMANINNLLIHWTNGDGMSGWSWRTSWHWCGGRICIMQLTPSFQPGKRIQSL